VACLLFRSAALILLSVLGLPILVGVDLLRHGQAGVAEDELSVAGRDAQVLEQGRGGVPQVVNLDQPQAVR
jgi:hypothetical protein